MSWRFLLSLSVSYLFNIIVNLLSAILRDTYFHFSAQSLLCWILARKVDRQGKICGNKKQVKLLIVIGLPCCLIFFINHNQSRIHSRPQVPRSFWSAPRIAQSICFIFSANQIWQNWGEVRESRTSDVGPAQKSPFWPKKSVASGNENVSYPESSFVTRHASLVSWPLFKGNEDAVLRGCHIINE